MRSIIQNNRLFFILFGIYLLVGQWLLFTYPKGDLVLFFDKHWNSFWDNFFVYTSYLGEGWVWGIIGGLVLLWRLFSGMIILVSFALSGLIAQFLKRVVFSDQLRPKAFFEMEWIDLHVIEGVKIATKYSFPSGHTTTAFAMMFALMVLCKNKLWGILFFVGAMVGGLSRVYLKQHFFQDTYMGVIIGVFTTVLVAIVFEKKDWFKDKKLGLVDVLATKIRKN